MGETLRSTYTRGKEHTKSLNRKEEWSALWKYCREKHDKIQKFPMNVTGFYSNVMLRQISEGVRINGIAEGSLMSSKNEWDFFQIPRAMVTSGGKLPQILYSLYIFIFERFSASNVKRRLHLTLLI